MASNTRRKSDITEVIQRHFDCPVCFEQFNEGNPAKALPCQHTFCVRCLEKVKNAGRIQCPQCNAHHVVPTEGIKNFKNNYHLMQLMGDLADFDDLRRGDSKSQLILCNLAVGETETVHNKVKDSQNQAGVTFSKAIDAVNKCCEDAKSKVTNDTDQLVERLRQKEKAKLDDIDKRGAVEIQRIEALKSELCGPINALARRCVDRLQELRQSGCLTGDQYENVQQETVELNQLLNDVVKPNEKLTYQTISLQKVGEGNAFDVKEIMANIGIIHESTREEPLMKVGYGIATLPNQSNVGALVRLPDRRRPSSESQATPPKYRDRNNDREVVKVFKKQSFSTDSPSFNGARVVLVGSMEPTRSTGAMPKHPNKPLSSSSRPFCFPKKPPLPERTQKPQCLETLPEQCIDSIAKVNIQLRPCAVLDGTDESKPMRPRSVIGLAGGQVAVATDEGFRLFDEHNKDITPKRPVNLQKTQKLNDLCSLPDGTLLATVDNQHSIMKFKCGILKGEWIVADIGGRLHKPVKPYGITCDRTGSVYVCDRGNCCVLVCKPDGTLRKVIGRDGLPEHQQLQDPMHLALYQPSETVLYIADSKRGAVMKYTVDGDFIRSYLEQNEVGRGICNPVTKPTGVTVTPCGNVVVTDSASHSVIVIDSRTGNLVKQFGAYGVAPGEFNTPLGVALVNNRLAICDFNNGRIQYYASESQQVSGVPM